MDHNVTYISASGLEDLKKEFAERVKVLRPSIAERITDAREMGDLSENFAYHDARDDQAQNESRIASLEEMIRTAIIVEDQSGGAISLGSRFVVSSPMGERAFSIVGESEANPMEGKLSNLSPLGHAFLGKSAGDVVEIEVPSGKVLYTILRIE